MSKESLKRMKRNQKKDGAAKRSTPAIRFGKELAYLEGNKRFLIKAKAKKG